jgi:two-component system, OmpR family, response regulator CpxR
MLDLPPIKRSQSHAEFLLVDDDISLGKMVAEYAAYDGYAVTVAQTGESGLRLAAERTFALVILDVMLPGIDGFEVLERLRRFSDVPVLMLTTRGTAADRVRGLRMGADDYLPKPFSPRELVARIKAVLRRSSSDAGAAQAATSVLWGPLRIDLRARCAAVNDHDLELTGAELRILEQLMRADAKAVTRDELMTRALGRRLLPTDRSLDTHVSNLRRKIAKYTDRVSLQSVRGTGYALALLSMRTTPSTDI